MQMLDSKSSTRLQEKQDSHQKTGSIVSSTIAMKGDQEIKESRLFISAMVNGVQCTILKDTGASLTILSYRLHAELVKTGENKLAPVTQRTWIGFARKYWLL